MTDTFPWRPFAAVTLVMLAAGIDTGTSHAQGVVTRPRASHVVIPFLANATKSTDLDFQGAECERSRNRNTMTCTFQQVFLTTSAVVPDTCLITTNRYERTFRRESETRWVSNEEPQGICGVRDVATLHDDGGMKWTLEFHKVVTRKAAAASCQTLDAQSETFSWQNIRRPLPCKFVQPGGLIQ
jgi:hypothetical protein